MFNVLLWVKDYGSKMANGLKEDEVRAMIDTDDVGEERKKWPIATKKQDDKNACLSCSCAANLCNPKGM